MCWLRALCPPVEGDEIPLCGKSKKVCSRSELDTLDWQNVDV